MTTPPVSAARFELCLIVGTAREGARPKATTLTWGFLMIKKTFTTLALFAGTLMTAPFPASLALAQDAPQKIEITAKRFSFDPAEITLKKGQPVVLVLKSADVAHGLRIKELNVNVKAPAHGTGQVEFTPGQAGDFVARCSVFCGSGHAQMMMKVHVVQ
jgi:cytochrome c oxidase subunit II